LSAEPYLPDRRTLPALHEAVGDCRGCDLWERATQAVFGNGPRGAPMMLVGEQPGDKEDRQGAPFVGPAGGLLDTALERAGIPPDRIYVTNAVKHFKWQPRGKRRIHQSPSRTEVVACRPWLEAEIDAVQPDVVVALGAVAAKSLFGPSFRVTRQRGEIQHLDEGRRGVATVHPSSILRQREDDRRHRELELFVDDLHAAWALVGSSASTGG
jgi:DNA polymerase